MRSYKFVWYQQLGMLYALQTLDESHPEAMVFLGSVRTVSRISQVEFKLDNGITIYTPHQLVRFK